MSGSVAHQAKPPCRTSSGAGHAPCPVPCGALPCGALPVRTFFTVNQGHASGAPGCPALAGLLAWARGFTKGQCLNGLETSRRWPQGWLGSLDAGGGSLARALSAAANRRGPLRHRSPAPAAWRSPPSRILVTAPARAAGPSSSRRALCRRAKITVKSAPYGRVLRMALRATPDCDLPRQRSGSYREDGEETRRFDT